MSDIGMVSELTPHLPFLKNDLFIAVTSNKKASPCLSPAERNPSFTKDFTI